MRKLIVSCDGCEREQTVEVNRSMLGPEGAVGWFDVNASSMVPVEPVGERLAELDDPMVTHYRDAGDLGLGPRVSKQVAAELTKRNKAHVAERKTAMGMDRPRYHRGNGEIMICDRCMAKRIEADPLWALLFEQINTPPDYRQGPPLPPGFPGLPQL